MSICGPKNDRIRKAKVIFIAFLPQVSWMDAMYSELYVDWNASDVRHSEGSGKIMQLFGPLNVMFQKRKGDQWPMFSVWAAL